METKVVTTIQISNCLWFDTQAEEAANFYISIFKDGSILRISRYPNVGQDIHGKPSGSVMVVEFKILGQVFEALNGGPHFKFNEAISFIINCDTQKEVDYYWSRLGEGGDKKAQVCGWLKDKYGVSWQIVPKILNEMLQDPAAEKANPVFLAMLKMKKLDIAELKKAFNSAK